jgi:hypothetical protein
MWMGEFQSWDFDAEAMPSVPFRLRAGRLRWRTDPKLIGRGI